MELDQVHEYKRNYKQSHIFFCEIVGLTYFQRTDSGEWYDKINCIKAGILY